MRGADLKIVAACGILLGLAGSNPGAMAQSDGHEIRVVIGIALLAEEQCEGMKRGPKFEQMIGILRVGAQGSGKTLDEAGLFARAKAEAAAKLKEVGRSLCDAASRAVTPNGIIIRR